MQTVANKIKIKDKVAEVEEMTVEMGKLQHMLKRERIGQHQGQMVSKTFGGRS